MSADHHDDNVVHLPQGGPPDRTQRDGGPPRASTTGLERGGPPHDVAAEQALLGAMMLSRTAVADAAHAWVTATAYYRPAHATIHDAITAVADTGATPDPLLVADQLGGYTSTTMRRIGGAPYLHELVAAVPTAANASYYARRIVDVQRRRQRWELALKLRDWSDNGVTPADFDQALTEHLHAAAFDVDGLEHDLDTVAPTIDALLAMDEPDHAWLVEGFLERRDRLLLVGPEGGGKTTWMRQTAVQLAAGLHPTRTGELITPCRVLVVDVENSERQNRREYRPLVAQARLAVGHDGLTPDNLRLVHRPSLNLADPADEAWLTTLVAAHGPDVLVIGPIYKLAGGDPNSEADAKPVVLAIDRVRTAHDCAVLLEHHVPKNDTSDPRKRRRDPVGWSGWLRWPEIGLHLAPEGDVHLFRGLRDAGREIPEMYERGGEWPWTPVTDIRTKRFAVIKRAVMDAARDEGKELSWRAMETVTGISQPELNRIKQHIGPSWAVMMANARAAIQEREEG